MECDVCGGTGWRIIERGGLSGALPCDCQLASRVKALTERAGIPRNLAGCSFGNLNIEAIRTDPVVFVGFVNVFLYARNYKPGLERPGMLIQGSPGTGKTHIAIAALRNVLAMGVPAMFFDCGNLLEQVRGHFGAKDGSRAEALSAALETEVLVLDDLGTETKGSEWVRDTISTIITHRCNHRKAMIATTSLNDEDLATNLGERSASRLREMCQFLKIPPATPDYREQNQPTRKRKGT